MSLGTEYLDPLFKVLQDFKENVNQLLFFLELGLLSKFTWLMAEFSSMWL